MRRYAKPVVVAEDLALLCGRTTGLVTLPRHLDWSGSANYDLDRPGRIVDLYRTVLIEATKSADLHAFLDKTVLIRLWPTLWLPSYLRQAWEERFPELQRPGSGAAAA
jgi:hypothetical protein